MYAVNRYVSRRRTMHQRSSRGWLASSLALVLTLVAGCMPIQPPATNLAVSKAITLSFALPNAKETPPGPGEPFEFEFIDQVKTLSQGSITIEPIWDAGSGTPDGYEKGVIQLVRKGKFDLGLASARTWDTQGIKSFQVLQAPFLITDDALTNAVATSEVAAKLLDRLSAVGMVGLSLWPEGLRHPFSVVLDKPLLSPQDFVGAQIRTPSSEVSEQLMKTLGARPMSGDSGYQGADSGLRQAYTLNGEAIPTGNITFYPKYNVLFANAAAFDRLSEAQRTVLRQAAAAAQQKVIAEYPKEVDLASAWCAAGHTIVLASTAQVAAFEQAAQPIFDQLAQDPANAAAIAAIRALKAKTPPSPAAVACAPTITAKPTSVQPTSAPTATVPVSATASGSMTRIVFVSHPGGNAAQDSNSDPHSEIYSMNADGSGQTNLTNNQFWDGEPTASPDGKRIAFASNRDGNSQIYAMNIDGSDVMRLTNNTTNDDLPVFSPDGKQIVFMSQRDSNLELYRMNADGSGQIRLTDNLAVDEFASWSPDGKQIIFDSERDGYAGIYTMKADGSDVVRLTDNQARDSRPFWSPDGKKILFESNLDGNPELYVMNPDGSDQTNLTNNPAQDYSANWSPDGKQIVFESNRDGTGDEIYEMNADGSHQARITHNPGDDNWATWIPGSAPTATVPMTSTTSVNLPRIVFTSHPDGNNGPNDTNAEIYMMNADGTNQTRLTNNQLWDNEPAASPDGKRIAFIESPAAPNHAQIYAMNADGSDVIRLTNNQATDDLPIFSPDGKQIVFFSDRDGNSEIYVMNADGSGQTNLTHNPALDEYPSWSPDGKKILFNSARDGYAGINEIRSMNGEIYVMNADGSNQTRLTHDGGHDGRPMWSPDGKQILFETDRNGHGELYVMNADGSNQINLTNNGKDAFAQAWSLDGQQIAFTTTRDGDFEIYVMNADGSNQTRLTNNPGDDIWAAWLPAASTP